MSIDRSSGPAVCETLASGEYLAREMLHPGRHEYVNGQVYALSGGSLRHGMLIGNLLRHALAAEARHPGCRVFTQGVKVHVASRNSYYYPDILATCQPGGDGEYIVTEPCFVVEVLSPSTASIDRREKRLAYTTLHSLREYVLVHQHRMRVDVYQRTRDDWKVESLYWPEQSLDLTCLDCSITLQQIYDGITLPPLRVRETAGEELEESLEEGWAPA